MLGKAAYVAAHSVPKASDLVILVQTLLAFHFAEIYQLYQLLLGMYSSRGESAIGH